MDGVSLYRGAGWAAIVSGVLLVMGWGLSYARGDLRSPSLLALWIGLAAFILMQVGLAGIYLRMHETSGWLGLVGFSLAFVGTAVFIGYTVGGEASPAIPEPSLGPLGGLAWAVGMLALAVAGWRAGSVPAVAALVWAAGTLVYEGGVATYSVGSMIGAVIFAIGLVGQGWGLWEGGDVLQLNGNRGQSLNFLDPPAPRSCTARSCPVGRCGRCSGPHCPAA